MQLSTRHITIFLSLLVATTTVALPTPKVLPIPAQHLNTRNAEAGTFIQRAYDSVREFSPFALAACDVEAEENVDIADQLKEFASQFIGTRYRAGASGPNNFDCSGFVGYVFRNFGFDLQRDSRSQYRQGEHVEKGDLRPGDLLFFSSRSSGKGRVGHVAMVTDVNPDGSCRFIHASSSSKGVEYQSFPDGGYYSRHYIGAKRIIGNI